MSLPWITCLAETCWHFFAEQYDADGWGAGSYHLLLLMFILLTQSLSHCWPGLQPHAPFVLLIQHQCTPVRGADTVNRKVLTHRGLRAVPSKTARLDAEVRAFRTSPRTSSSKRSDEAFLRWINHLHRDSLHITSFPHHRSPPAAIPAHITLLLFTPECKKPFASSMLLF